MAVVIPELYIKEIVIEYYPAAIITELKIPIKIKLIIIIIISYIPTKSKEDIKTEDI
jgi:hypothetical protein